MVYSNFTYPDPDFISRPLRILYVGQYMKILRLYLHIGTVFMVSIHTRSYMGPYFTSGPDSNGGHPTRCDHWLRGGGIGWDGGVHWGEEGGGGIPNHLV